MLSPQISRSRRCVIADDVRLIRRQLGEWARELGFSVTSATCGATALRAVRQAPPSLLVTDIDMPHISGLHLLQSVREDPNPQIASIPVIVSSSLEDGEMLRLVERLGGSVFLPKPIAKDRFLDCVSRLLRGERIISDPSGIHPHQISSRFRRITSDLSGAS